MMTKPLKATLLASALLAASQTHATTVDVITDGRWYQFDADDIAATSGGLEWIDAIVDNEGNYSGDGSALSFTFSLDKAAVLTVVDAGFAGDEFQVAINGQNYFSSSVPQVSDFSSVGTDFAAALADGQHYSYLSVLLNPGSYTVSGNLLMSATDESGSPFNATVGGLQVSEVPIPAAAWFFASALATGAGFIRRRRA